MIIKVKIKLKSGEMAGGKINIGDNNRFTTFIELNKSIDHIPLFNATIGGVNGFFLIPKNNVSYYVPGDVEKGVE